MVSFPFRGWWVPGRGCSGEWALVGVSLPVRVPCLVLCRAVGGGPRSWLVVLPASLSFVGGVGVGGGVVVVGSSVRVAVAGGVGVWGGPAWSAAWAAAGPVAWSAVWPLASVRVRQRWLSSVPGAVVG